MPYHNTRPQVALSFIRQKVRVLSPREAPQPCATLACRKVAKGENHGKVYCGEHFLAAVQQQWL